MPAEGYALGIDFGTSNTVAVLRRGGDRARPLLFDGSPILPSAVYLDAGGTLLVGADALQSARLDPARFEPNPKRQVDDSVILLGDRELPVTDLFGAVLSRVADEARRTGGGDPRTVTITCPAGWGATRRLVLTDSATGVGLPAPTLVEEPVAAAAYFARVLGRDVPIGSVVVVHDLGAGTFDASVVARTSGGFEVLAVDGRTDIGGIDVDQALVEHIGAVYAERNPAAWERLIKPSTVDERRNRKMFLDDVRAVKERLSRQTTADLVIPLLEVDVHLTREELERLAQPLLEQTVRLTQGVMRWARLAEGRVAGVFLVGGSTRIPLMATLLHRALGEAPVAIEQPELVVAEGSLVVGSARPISSGAWVSGSPSAPPSVRASARVTSSAGTGEAARPEPKSAPPVPNPGAIPAVPPPVAPPAPAEAPVAKAAPTSPPVMQVPVNQAAPVNSGPVYRPGRAGIPVKKAAPPADTRHRGHHDEPALVFPARRAPAPAPQQARQQAPRYASAQRPGQPRYQPAPRRPSAFGRFVKYVFVTLLLVTVVVVATYVAIMLSHDKPLWPVPVEKIIERLSNL